MLLILVSGRRATDNGTEEGDREQTPSMNGSEAWTEHVVLASARVPGKVEEVAMLQYFPKID